MAKTTIPVYDLQTVNRKKLHEDIVAETLPEILKVLEQLISPHRQTFYHIVLITNGGGIKTIDFEQFEVRPSQIYFMIPGQIHSWNFTGNVDGYVLNFSEKIFVLLY